MHVDPAYQGKGLGKQLMQQAATWLFENTNNKSMFLWVFEANHSARKFYDALGGVNHEVSNELMPDGYKVAALRYVWHDCRILLNS